MEKGLQRISAFIKASLHRNLWPEKRKKSELELKLVYQLIELSLLSFSTKICKLSLIGEVFEVSFGVHCSVVSF